MWGTSAFTIEMPSNAAVYAGTVLHRRHDSDEVKVFTDTVSDLGIAMDAGGKKLPSEFFWAERGAAKQKTVLIDNTNLAYVPIKLPCGVTTYCSPDVLSGCPMVLRSIQTDLQQIFKILPPSVHALIRRTNVWINATYSYGSRDDPRLLRHSTAHHSEGWLIHCARDIPDKARGIEIYNCYDFERMRLHWNGSGLLLHEFCHIIHQFCLDLNNEKVKEIYENARYSGRYDQTLRRDWAGLEEDYDMAYALVDQKEFFAEMSVTFLSNGYRELDKADTAIMECCSPPLLQPSVTDRVLKQYGIDDPLETEEESGCSFLFSVYSKRYPRPKLRIVDPVFQQSAIGRSCVDVVHCNKFYPFTRGQLRHHDPDLYRAMQGLWREIARWNDPEDDVKSQCSLKSMFFPLFY